MAEKDMRKVKRAQAKKQKKAEKKFDVVIDELNWNDLVSYISECSDMLLDAYKTAKILPDTLKLRGYKVSLDEMRDSLKAIHTSLTTTVEGKVALVDEDDVLDYMSVDSELGELAGMIAVISSDIITDVVASGVSVGLGEDVKDLQELASVFRPKENEAREEEAPDADTGK